MAKAVPVPPEHENLEKKSVSELLRRIIQESSELIQKEFQLLREELSIAFAKAGIATGKIAAGAVLLILAVGFLGFSLIVLLSSFITPWVSAALVGLAFLLAGAIIIFSALRDFRNLQAAPRTVETLKEDAEWLRHPTRPEER